ncbi:Uma2 family endonuclease [Argonema galeatum]|uniref:Uma2 family endonuclease n=1 Tax=Argonema galeatum TaxID=2942762 RepID=UPI0020132D18|nr:Uma2 family endonuclease [Argonema galeatum]MCL1467152.1 Uma2 family endonuclease [Argonema galeatum A003/A1]
MLNVKTKLPTDEWVAATWDEYIEAISDRKLENAKTYYYKGQLRIDMTPQGYDHSYDNSLIGYCVQLFGGIRGIPISGLTNCTFRRGNEAEAQPDLAFYIGENAEIIPPNTTIVDLNIYPPPDLVIEIAKTSLADDIGSKRMLYEQLGVREYWVVNVVRALLIAFAIADGGSRQITQSQVLPNLPFSLLEEALRRGRESGRSQIYGWLIGQMQEIGN